MSKYDGAIIEAVNWEKYNPRTDSRTHVWFRMENKLALGKDLFGMNCEHRWIWVTIMSMISEESGKPIEWNSAYIEAHTGISASTQDQAIDIIIKKGYIKVTCKLLQVTSSNISTPCLRTYERTNETDGTDGTDDTKLLSVSKTSEEVSSPIIACKKTWIETLAYFGQKRNLTSGEERLIAMAIQSEGAETVDLALFGARYEPTNEMWKPKEHVDIARVLTKDKEGRPRIQKFYGYGVAERGKEESRKARELVVKQTRQAIDSEVEGEQDPERLHALMESVFNKKVINE